MKKLFESYEKQSIKDFEIIVVDSGSADRSVAICNEYKATVKQIQSSAFNHGLTRQFGVECSKGKYVLLTVQDAIPENENFLETLLNCFNDEELAAVCGLQVVPVLPETSPFHWYRPVSKPTIRMYQFESAASFDRLSAEEKKSICSWDDVCAMYKRKSLEAIPFRAVSFGEDMAWCKEALRAGKKICYDPNARVYHYHESEDDYLYKRTLTEYYHYYKLFGSIPHNNNLFMSFLRAKFLLLKEKRVPFFQKFTWLYREMKYQLAVRRSTNDFLRYLHKGETELDLFHKKICGIAPQAPGA